MVCTIRLKYEYQSAFILPQPVRETLVSTSMLYTSFYFFGSKTVEEYIFLGAFA